MPLIDPAVAGNLAVQLADGTLEDAGIAADDLMPVVSPAVANRLVKLAADGTLVDAGMIAGIVTAEYGGAIGRNASASDGGAIGDGAVSTFGGGAVGVATIASGGGAVGDTAAASQGGAIGAGSKTGDGFAGGLGARAVDGSQNGIDAIQLGTGTNSTPNTLQIYSNTLLNADGSIPYQRVTRPLQNDIVGTTHTFVLVNEGQIVAAQSGSPTVFTIPLNSAQAFPIGAIVGIERQGGGTLAITATAGVTLNGVDGASKSVSVQWGAAAIRKTATNAWVIIGAIA
jgi:hypothetical protein